MTELDETYWNSRYIENKAGWDLGSISTPLKDYFDQLPDKTISILIPGAGNAYEAEYLFEQGFKNSYLCDLAKVPLKNFQKRCPGFDPNHLLHQNFFDLEENKYDLIVEQTFFCAIDPLLRKDYAEKVFRLLKPGGKLVGVLFNDTFSSAGPPFGGSADEYRAYFKDLFQFKTFETAYNSIKPRAGRELFINLIKPA